MRYLLWTTVKQEKKPFAEVARYDNTLNCTNTN